MRSSSETGTAQEEGLFLTPEEEEGVARGEAPAGETRHEVGRRGEDLACRFLWRHAFRILERNYQGSRGEIDIVAEKKGCIHFVEVKTRTTDSLGRPEERVDAKKREILRETARIYLRDFREPPPAGVQFDVLAQVVHGQRPVRQTLLENAF
ncbi:MAG TPA: YraN family protein [Sumerlaeia bacterium]|nr:YraN family protein [Sumerlaeia bacterium]